MTPDALCAHCHTIVERIELDDRGLCVPCRYGLEVELLRPTPGPGEVRSPVPTAQGEPEGGPGRDGFCDRVGSGVDGSSLHGAGKGVGPR